MARLYTYGKLKRVNNVPGANALPGTYVSAQGVQMGQGVMNTTPANPIEFGEIVELVNETQKGLGVKRATSSIDIDKAVLIIRDVVGVNTIQSGVAEKADFPVPSTGIKMNSAHGWDVVVPIVTGQNVLVGTTVRIGTGAGSTVLGGLYATAITTNTVALTGWVYKSSVFKPTSSDGECVWIGKA